MRPYITAWINWPKLLEEEEEEEDEKDEDDETDEEGGEDEWKEDDDWRVMLVVAGTGSGDVDLDVIDEVGWLVNWVVFTSWWSVRWDNNLCFSSSRIASTSWCFLWSLEEEEEDDDEEWSVNERDEVTSPW